MGLDEIRTLEDLKASYSGLAKEYNSRVDKEKDRALESVVKEFAEFFSRAKFDVQSSPNQVIAKYGSSSVTLNYANPFGYMGLSIRMELAVTLAAHKPQALILGFNSQSPSISFSVSSSKQQTVHEEIEAEKSKIENLKNKISNFSAPPFKLFVKPKDSAGPFTAYGSLADLLNEITS